MRAFCMYWHINMSDAFREFLVKPLSPWVSIELTPWDGEKVFSELKAGETIAFCQLPPPQEILDSASKYSITWLPMWDHAKGYSQQWWNGLPKTIKVVAFSREVADKAKTAGLPLIELQYFINPLLHPRANWEKERVLLYWNRTGMIGPKLLRRLCDSLSVDRLLFLPTLDPYIPEDRFYILPRKLGRTEVEVIRHTNREEFLARTSSANIFIAPRISEGVGISFLEKMAKGAAVFAFKAPTMSEYILDGKNGYYFSDKQPTKSLHERLTGKSLPYTLSERSQDWKRITALDLKALGDRAREDHVIGYRRWQKSISTFADFIQS
jgi:glycosyltransferase involved in cell wall biosynthesis